MSAFTKRGPKGKGAAGTSVGGGVPMASGEEERGAGPVGENGGLTELATAAAVATTPEYKEKDEQKDDQETEQEFLDLDVDIVGVVQLGTAIYKTYENAGLQAAEKWYYTKAAENRGQKKVYTVEARVREGVKKTIAKFKIPVFRINGKGSNYVSCERMLKNDCIKYFLEEFDFIKANPGKHLELRELYREAIVENQTKTKFRPMSGKPGFAVMRWEARHIGDAILTEAIKFVQSGMAPLHKILGQKGIVYLRVLNFRELLALYEALMPLAAAFCRFIANPYRRLRYLTANIIHGSNAIDQGKFSRVNWDIVTKMEQAAQAYTAASTDPVDPARALRKLRQEAVKYTRGGWKWLRAMADGRRLHKFVKEDGKLDEVMPDTIGALRAALGLSKAMAEAPDAEELEGGFEALAIERRKVCGYAEFGLVVEVPLTEAEKKLGKKQMAQLAVAKAEQEKLKQGSKLKRKRDPAA